MLLDASRRPSGKERHAVMREWGFMQVGWRRELTSSAGLSTAGRRVEIDKGLLELKEFWAFDQLEEGEGRSDI